jgi:ferritin-like metal-binding protein YciE
MNVSSWFSKMIGASMTLDNLRNVLVMQLRDLASAEEQLILALPQMAEAACSGELQDAFRTHMEETRQQRSRLDLIFRMLGEDEGSENCEAMEGLISEAEEIIALEGEPDVRDAALIAAAQRIEHYEIAGYGCARSFAKRLGYHAVASILQEILDEEGTADKILTDIAESSVNSQAAQK